jgi:hypothetical protein
MPRKKSVQSIEARPFSIVNIHLLKNRSSDTLNMKCTAVYQPNTTIVVTDYCNCSYAILQADSGTRMLQFKI